MRLDSFFSGALCVMSGGRLPAALFLVFLLDSKGAKACTTCRSRQELSNEYFLANFWRARSRLYQNETLQENMRSTAFFKFYKICILLHRCNPKFFAKIGLKKSAIFVKIQNSANICKIVASFSQQLLIFQTDFLLKI